MSLKATTYIKFALKALAAILILLIVALLLLRLPAVQTKLANFAVNLVSKTTNTEISIDKIALNFIDNASAKGVFLADEKGDTLLYAEKLNVDIGIFKLLKNTVDIDLIELSNSKINIYKKADSSFSFQFLIDAFSSDTATESAPWTIEIDKVKIKYADYNFDLLQAKNNLKLKSLLIKSDEIDFEEMFFLISKIEIDQMELSSIWKDSGNEVVTSIESTDLNEDFPFPLRDLPISLVCKQLEIKESKAVYQKGNVVKSDYFDVKNINAQNINIELEDIEVNKNKAQLSIEDIQVNLNNQFFIEEAQAELLFAKEESYIENLQLKTKKSNIEIEGKTSYKKFEDLINFKNGTPIDLNLKKMNLVVHEAVYFLPFLDTVSYLNQLKNDTLNLTAFANGTIDDLEIENITAVFNKSNIEINGRIINALKTELLKFENFNIKANTNINQLQAILGDDLILDKYNYFGQIDIDAELNGSLEQLNIAKFSLNTEGLLHTSFNGKLNSLLDVDNLNYLINVQELKTGIDDLEILVDSLPEMLQNFEFINYVGTISGGIKKYEVEGKLLSPLGSATSDLALSFNEDFTNATYKGQLQLDTFNIGKLLAVDSLGSVSFKADVNGEGLSLEDLNAQIDAVITQVSFNNYNYNNIKIDGAFLQKEFIGQLNIDDENLKFDFDGKINLNDSIPDLDFDAQLKHINTLALKLTNFPLKANLNLDAKLKGLSVNDIVGDIKIKDLNLDNNEQVWSTDSIIFLVEKAGANETVYTLNSPFLTAQLEGDFGLSNIHQIFISTFDKYLSVSPIFASDSTEVKPFVLTNENIHLDISLSHPEKIVSFFNIDLKQLDTAFLHIALDEPKSLLDIEFFAPAIQYGSIYVDSIYWKADGENQVFNNNISIDSISFTESIYIPGIKSVARFENQKGFIKTFIDDVSDKYSLALNTQLRSENEHLYFNIQSPLTLNAKQWSVDNNEEAFISKENFYIPNFTMVNGNEKLVFNYSNDLKSVDFTNFNLNNFTDLIEIDSTEIVGLINGQVSLEKHEDHIDAKGNLKIEDIKVNDLKVGDLVLDVSQKNNIVIANLDLRDGGNYLNLIANYDASKQETDAEVRLYKFNLNTIAPIVQDYAKNLEGYITGNVKMLNNVDDLSLNGILEFNGVKALIVPLSTSYQISKGQVKFDKKSISPNLTIADEINRNAFLSGTIKHDNFTDYKFDLTFNTPAFTFLNSTKKEDDLIFGKLVAKVDATVKGSLDLPKIKGDITTVDESDISIQLLSEKSIATQEEFVIFLNGSSYNEAEIDSIANDKYKVNSSIDLDLNVVITEKATVRVVIDPLTGDNLVVNGNGTLAVKMPPYGDIDITGVYTVNSGLYSFSFQQLLRKRFEIVKGSQLKFAGNPMNATLDIQAAYNTDASTVALIESETATLSSEEQQALKKKTEVSVLLNMDGKLSDPILSFDIKIADNSSGPVGSSVTRALNKVKQNESELNKQVFSLLLFNSFTSTSSTGNISSAGTSTAVRSVGNLINSQLNKLAGKANGLEINFDLDQYADQFSESGSQITDVELGISQSLFNDKLVISVGGNVGLESGQSENGALSSVAGDFVLSYKITSDGKYNVKVFQKSDFDALNDANVWKTGAGFSYQTKFGRLRKIKRHGEK